MHPFVEELTKATLEPRRAAVTYRVPSDPNGVQEPFSIPEFLDINLSELSPTASRALEAIEAPGGDHHDAWTDLKWKLTAFTYLQDIFDTAIRESSDALLLLQQYYFYFESHDLLAESMLCGLNGFYVGAQALLRPFLEFSILQNYYYRVLRDARSYQPLEQYFKTGVSPATNTLVKKCMPDDDFCRPIRFRLQQHLGGLSQSTLHPYHPNHSVRQHTIAVGAHSLEGLHFWFMTRLVIEAALWVYYVNFPLLFQPIDILRKFGHGGPVGVFADQVAATAVRQSLSERDYAEFKSYSVANGSAAEAWVWANGLPDLTDAEIEKSWPVAEYGSYPGLWAGFCAEMARMRAIRRLLALRREVPTDMPDEILRSVNSLAGWRTFSSRSRQRTGA